MLQVAVRIFQCAAFAFAVVVSNVLAKETVEDAAILARNLIASPQAIGVMATIFHPNSSLHGEPFALQEYYASCYENGSLSLINMPISRHTQNIMHSPTHSASISVWSNPPSANRARVALMGNVTFLDTKLAIETGIQDCYLQQHPDAQWWLPGDPDAAHIAYWARFDPFSVFFFGGFGDKHYIGDVPLELYKAAIPSRSNTGAEMLNVQLI